MRKKIFGKQLSRSRKSREALFRSLTREVILKGEITTTFAKAKAVQRDLEKLAKLAKATDVTAKRKALAMLGNSRESLDNLYTKYAKVFEGKTSGFTKIVKLPVRRGDAAEMAKIGFVKESNKPQVTKEK